MTSAAASPPRSASSLRRAAPLLGALVVVAVLTALTPKFDYESRYRFDDVAVGQTGRLREYDVRVLTVRLGHSLRGSDRTVKSSAVFVVVTMEAAVRLDAQTFQNISLVTRDDRQYEPRPQWSTAAPRAADPGFSSRGTLVFEVPQQRLAGARLVVGPDQGEVTTFDAAARVDLQLSELPQEPEPLTVPEPSVWVTR